MKKLNKGFIIVFALLIIWAAADFYHYINIGQSLTEYYPNSISIQRVVQNSLFQGTVKLILAFLILTIGSFMAKRKSQHTRSLSAITALLAVSIIGTWLLSMYCLSSVTAEMAADRYAIKGRDRASSVMAANLYDWQNFDTSKYQNYWEYRFWEAVDSGAYSLGRPIIKGDNGFIKRRQNDELYVSTAIYDSSGRLMACSWQDYFFFEYMTEAEWLSGQERSRSMARALFDREKLTELGIETLHDDHTTFDFIAMRFTGSFDGSEFKPICIEAVTEDDFDNAKRQRESSYYTVSGIIEDYDVPWQLLYEDNELAADDDMITVYSDWFDVHYQQESPSFNYNGKYYSNIDALLEELGPKMADGSTLLHRYEGTDLLLVSTSYKLKYDDKLYSGSSYAGPDGYQGEAPEVQFYVASAVYCSPWRTAFYELRNIYFWTLAAAIALLLIARSKLRTELISPLQQLLTASEKEAVRPYRDQIPKWKEPRELWESRERTAELQQMRLNEIRRLETALDYAKSAEENRRQMTSNIAHELKTPLALIHSYAEGLKENIAEDKRDQYLDVILSETERTDALVLEMLDLSRLEAGKVKLARDEFSLSELTKTTFRRLKLVADEKKLNISFDLPSDCVINADESRMAQVIENFISNAVKYTPVGGSISLKLNQDSSGTLFSIENDCETLSAQELSKVWEAFYRSDKSRSGGGTGLGLAITKSIVELHGGKCYAENTKSGVKFSFKI